MTIIIRVKDQSLRAPANLPDIISGSQEFVKFQFVLENDWDGLTTFAQFRQNERAYNQYLDFENCVYLPAEIEQGIVTLMLYGTGNNTIATTNYLTLSVNQHHLVSDAQSTAISQSLYAQLVAQVNQLEGIISGSVSGGDGGSSGGSDGGSAGAAAINTHNTSATAHDARFAGKVDKIEGKGLSTNDYTNAEKTKLAEIAANANNYTHPTTHSASMITGLASVEAITGGQRLTINDADGAHVLDILASTGGGSGDNEQPIDDDVISSANPWSSEKIVDTLCPPFEISGNPVTCYPVAGSQLRVKASVEPALRLDWLSREGETTQDGVPSADEPIPLVDSVPAGSYYVPSTASGGGYWRVDLSEALGGVDTYNDAIEIDAFTGQWRIVRRTYLLTLNGTQNITYSGAFFSYSNTIRAVSDIGVCNRYRIIVPPMSASDDICFIMAQTVIHFRDSRFNDAELYKLHMFAEPIVVRYAVATPIITTGQATHVTSTAGLTALNAVSMGLTAPDSDHPCEIALANSVHIVHNDTVYDVALPEGFEGGEVNVLNVIAQEGTNTITTDGQPLTVSGRADPIHIITSSGSGGVASILTPIVSVPYSADVTLTTGIMTEIGTLTGACAITLGAQSEGYCNEYGFTIQQGATAQTITLPTVQWDNGFAPTFSANTATVVWLYYSLNTLRGVWTV